MKNKLTAAFLLAAAALFAQGPRGPRTPAGTHRAAAIDMTRLTTITGTVAAVNLAYGLEYPTITVNQAVIKIAPVWYFLENNFEIKAGDAVAVVAAPSRLAGDAYLYGIEIANTATGARIVLRDASGVPLWSGPGGGRGSAQARRSGGGCVELASIATVSGTIEKLTMGAGIQMPSLVLKTGDGQLLTIKIGPERIVLEADLELQAGQSVTVRYGSDTYTGELLALQITNSASLTVTLRNDDGTPAWN